MRTVEWTDDQGYMRRRSIPDSDPDEFAMMGIPDEPPNLDDLDWVEIRRDLHNQLMARKIYTWKDVARAQVGVTAAVRAALVRPLLQLYKENRRR